ncbi:MULTISPECIES: cysteine desulfurase family protein [unclassified Ruminococcus]|uniref:cysteine desulfurase family protein n=1 Tax=unclassified Ruminococcus TaxID=2608920 RepID=UPI00210C0193|nr:MULTISPECIES: cysteine desulfurase family protein [unclassified Ruminococcus]MCQ4022225.1 aminotransferase class V-fold PLP-dependent enzyme [Ruminococcus sp. zg-924]MCQ4115212.1 aminotransferase class V-fold PLP-dependent enzyme [Ruminococcus sp. zg-921]
MQVYFDNSATTRVSKNAADKAYRIMTEVYGNPSSLHSLGIKAEAELTSARKSVAKSLGADEREIYFTSGATEANNLALFGTVESRKRTGNKIVTSAIEHSSVIDACKRLENMGYEVVYLKPRDDGRISETDLQNAVDENTVLVSLMAVNNETGAIQPYNAVKRIIKQKNSPALFHCDCVQAYGKLMIKAEKIGADLLSVTAHKIHGPKGVGAIYIKRGTRIIPQHYGGEQESKIRPGTQASALIGAFGCAVNEIDYSAINHVAEIRDYIKTFVETLDRAYINSPKDALPYILNVSIEGIRSETMMHFLASREIYASSGSACAKGKQSHVLTAMGLSKQRTDSALRLSFSRLSTMEEAEYFCRVLKEGTESLVRK